MTEIFYRDALKMLKNKHGELLLAPLIKEGKKRYIHNRMYLYTRDIENLFPLSSNTDKSYYVFGRFGTHVVRNLFNADNEKIATDVFLVPTHKDAYLPSTLIALKDIKHYGFKLVTLIDCLKVLGLYDEYYEKQLALEGVFLK